MRSAASFLLIFAFISGCAQTSDLARPRAPIPEKWEDTKELAETAGLTHWRSFFSDLRLRALIEAALDNNRDLRIAIGRMQEAKSQYGVVGADRYPSLTLGPAAETPITNGYNAPLATVTYDLDLWGRISGMTESARFSFLASREARRAVQLTLVADVASAYYEMRQLTELATIYQAAIDLRAHSLELMGRGRDLGAINDNDYLQAAVALENARGSLASVQHQRKVAANRLVFLVGKANIPQPEGKDYYEASFDAVLRPGIPSQVLLLRPDVMASEQRLRAAHANIGVARAAFFPKIAINAGFGTVAGGLASLFTAGTATPVLLLPALWDAGRATGGVDVAQARREIAVAEYEKTIQQAFREVADQLSARESLARQMLAATAAKTAQERRLTIARGRYDGGMTSYREVLDGQQDLLSAQQSVVNLRRAQLEAEIQLYKALGGGDRNDG